MHNLVYQTIRIMNLGSVERDTQASPAASADNATNAAPSMSVVDIRATLQLEIEQGILSPGTALEERSLAARFGVSRTKVRQALHQMAGIDLISIEPYFGARVTNLSVSELRDILEYCCELEVLVARLAARRIDGESRRAIEEALAFCREEAVRPDGRYTEANKAFHDALCQAARSAFLVKHLRQARGLLLRYAPSQLDTPTRVQRSMNEHAAIAQAVLEQDEDRAGELMAAHLPTGLLGFSEFLARIPAHLFNANRS